MIAPQKSGQTAQPGAAPAKRAPRQTITHKARANGKMDEVTARRLAAKLIKNRIL